MERGPVGSRFAANLRGLRRAREWDQARLAAELDDLGHPIGINSISRLEKGERRADVSDLVALAIALECSPSRLFLSDAAPDDGQLALTANLSVEWHRAWAWAAGEHPLSDSSATSPTGPRRLSDYAHDARWRAANRPDDLSGRVSADEVLGADLGNVAGAIRDALLRGIPAAVVFAYLDFLKPAMISGLVTPIPDGDDGVG